MAFTLTIRTDNAAFGETDHELAEAVGDILTKLARKLTTHGADAVNTPLMDSNGNKVGEAQWVEC